MSHYFSRVRIKPGALRSVLKQTGDAYREHALVWKLFPGDDKPRDFLFRADADEQGVPIYYIVSQRSPKAFSEAWQVQSRAYDPQLKEGQCLSFHLRANPTVTKKSNDGKSQRHDVVMQAKKQLLSEHGFSKEAKWVDWKDESKKPLLYELVQKHCAAWLSGVGGKNGFEISLTADDEPQHKLQIDAYEQSKAVKRDHNIRFSTVDFSGELLVTNPALFQQVLFNGIGHAKAFGCGLLLVRRV